MATGTLGVLMKIGIISEEMTPPRQLTGLIRILFSVIAVGYSTFFLYISFAGPPREEYFKGTFMLGVIVLSILLFRNRLRSVREGFVWLDELFAAVSLIMLCAMLAIWADWLLGEQTHYWRRYYDAHVLTVGIVGGAIGFAIYGVEAVLRRRGSGLSLSDLLFLGASIASIVWWVINVQDLRESAGSPPSSELVIFSVMLSAASYEIARRIVGPIIPLLGFLFFIYSFEPIAQALPGVLHHGGDSFERVMEFLMASTEGMLGLIVDTFATYVVIFVILGAFLEKTGLGSLIIDAAYRMTGRRTGGPGLAAVISSGFFGMISGSGVANVMTTGTLTIPLMKRVGYRPEFAGAVEAAASTGGAYMPPIMGAGAFFLAELTETPYSEVILIALIPALLYYLSVGLVVYFRAVRFKLHGVPLEELPQWSTVLPRLHLLLPIPAMVYLLVSVGDSPFLAAAKTIVLIVLLRACDLLNAIRTKRSDSLLKPFLAASVVVGVIVYVFGAQIGRPFTWFIEDYVGFDLVDAGFWVIVSFIVLKVAEIAICGPDEQAIADPAKPHLHGESVARHGDSGITSVGRALVAMIRTIWEALEAGARNTLVVTCIAGVLGILLAAATQSNLPARVSEVLVAASFGLLPLTIFWVIVAGYIVGMGLPITASYVILAVFAVGALNNLGVDPLIAHMICYWVAVVSAVTPPVALAAYAASAISGGDPVKTGNQALKIASMILITPFIFAYAPAILLIGTPLDIVITTAANVLGVVAWAKFLDGFGIGRPVPLERLWWLIAATLILMPVDALYDWIFGMDTDLRYATYVAATAIMLGVYLYQRTGRRAVPA